MNKRLKQLLTAAAICAVAVLLLDRIFPPPLSKADAVSVMVTDRNGRPLRAFPTEAGGWRFAADLDATDPAFIEALLQVEDKRFYSHWGVDWFGLIRAATSSARAGHIVSGGSTITMQTARMLEPRERTIGSKLIEMIRATQIEARLSKREIMELYLTLTPYGGNLEGIRAASWAYFGAEPDELTDDQIALLIALPQSPEMRRPDRHPERSMASRAEITTKLLRHGFLDEQRASEVREAALPGRHAFPARAWHAADKARSEAGGNDARSTLDAALQADLQALATRKAEALGPDVQIAIMVVDIHTRAVRASVGSASRQRPGGWLDLTAQARSPGSTLKPFIYALAFDDGTVGPDTLIADLPKRFASYQPENFDRTFRGDVRISEALQHSLNVPAVLMLDRVGPERFAALLALVGAPPRISGSAAREPGLALALGGAGLTARELVMLYAALGDGGRAKPLVWLASEEEASIARKGRRLVGAASAASILTILENAPTPAGRMPGRLTANAPQIAFKTGTSYGFRDAWAAAVSGNEALVVWVGRADGAPRPGATGRTTALPILFDVADRAALRLGGPASSEDRITSATTIASRGAQAMFAKTDTPPEILFPPRNAELWTGPINGEEARAFVLAGRGESALSWYVNGEPCLLDDAGEPIWQPSDPGFYMVSAVDDAGRTSRVRVRVIGPTTILN